MNKIITLLSVSFILLEQVVLAQTIFQPGDIAIIGYKTNLTSAPSSCGTSYSTDDLVAFLTFKDITLNTKIIITDCGYNGTTNKFRTGEGIVEFTRTGATISAGTIFYIAFGDAPAICGTGNSICANGWSVASVQNAPLTNLDLNSTTGDQLFLLQGTFTSPNDFTGNFIYAMTTTGVWNFQDNATSSDLPAALNCLNFISTNTNNSRYNGPITPNTRTNHLVNIYNTTNWTTANVLTTPNCPTNTNFVINGLPTNLVINPEPPSGSAGPNQNICGTTTTMAATGAGIWSVIQGTGNFSNLTDPNATVTGLSAGINIFRWTLNNCLGIHEVTITATPIVTPSVSISVNPNTTVICTGTSVTFTATPTNGGTNPSYQWKINGNDVGTNSSTFTTNSLQNNDQVSVVLTSNANCANPTMVNSNVLTFSVKSLALPNIVINANRDLSEVCKGEEIVFSSSVVHGGNAPAYQWLLNGNILNGESDNTLKLTTRNLDKNNNTLQARLTSNENCVVTNVVFSNSISFMLKECQVAELFIPDVFTPSQSGRNATFKIEGERQAIRDFECQIFDRLGNLVYETNSFTEINTIGWNGKYKDNELPTGVYFWQISGTDQDGNKLSFQGKQRGIVRLVR